MAAKKHHCSVVVNFLGPSAKLLTADLPTLRDILKQCQLLLECRVGPRNIYNVSDMASDVLPLILSVWNRANAKLVQRPIRLSDEVLIEKIKQKYIAHKYCREKCQGAKTGKSGFLSGRGQALQHPCLWM